MLNNTRLFSLSPCPNCHKTRYLWKLHPDTQGVVFTCRSCQIKFKNDDINEIVQKVNKLAYQ
jgi:Zn-finger protein